MKYNGLGISCKFHLKRYAKHNMMAMMMITMIEDDNNDGDGDEFTWKVIQNIANMIEDDGDDDHIMMIISMMVMMVMVSPERVCRTWPV